MAKKILIVDDEPDITKVLAARLKENHFDVDTASNGAEGLQRVQENRPDLIIIDIMMPVMSGTEFASVLKMNPETSSIPFIFLSALQTKEEEQHQSGIVGGKVIFAKPFDIRILVEKINEIIWKVT